MGRGEAWSCGLRAAPDPSISSRVSPQEARIRSVCSGSSVDEPKSLMANARPVLIVARFRGFGPWPRSPSWGRRRILTPESWRLARCPRCRRLFALCSHCDRGHVYCGRLCSGGARCDSLRRARRRHRRSPEGRLDHRDRERERRRRRRLEARVGDHPSATPELTIKLAPALDPSGISTEGTPADRVEKVEILDAPRPVRVAASSRVLRVRRCRVCGRLGRWFRTAPVSRRGRGRPAAIS